VSRVGRLATLRPGSRVADQTRWAIEHALMALVQAGGRRAAERAVAVLNARGHRFALTDTFGFLRVWRETLAGGQRTIELSVNVNRLFKSTSVRYRSIPRLTAKARATTAIQDAFYARYMAVGQRAYRANGFRGLSSADRIILLVAELEAGVNNGGFRQYLDNKGRRRAGAAVRALEAIGAERTARMLATALQPGTTEKQRDRLDDLFYRVPEDLAVLAMRRVAPERRS
jgi:hypothetical protein